MTEEQRAKRIKTITAAHYRWRSEGRCYDCGKPAEGKWRCEKCRERVNRYRRDRGYR